MGNEAGIYLHDWKKGGFIQMVADFEGIFISAKEFNSESAPYENQKYWLEKKNALSDALASEKYSGMVVLLASYFTEPYEGDAFVLFSKEGQLFEVNGSHCSCYELGGMWEPEETTIEALLHRLDSGYLGKNYDENIFADELRVVLSAIK